MNVNSAYKIVIAILLGLIVFLYVTRSPSTPGYEQEYKDAMKFIEKMKHDNFNKEMEYIENIVKIQKKTDSLLKENKKLKDKIDETPIPSTDPVTDDAALLDSILHYARK